ncbi:hypothetical protein BVY04_00020, partial [bacterium M21]
MSNELNLSVPTPKSRKKSGSPITPFLLIAILGVCGAHLALSLKPAGQTAEAEASTGLAPEALKDLAIKLENQQLRSEAV